MPRKKKTLSQDETMQIQAVELVPGQMVCANDGTYCKVVSIDPVVDLPDRNSGMVATDAVVARLDRINHTTLELFSGSVTIKVA
jgi:SepF-like predicted cell division protein (DUF552 family)